MERRTGKRHEMKLAVAFQDLQTGDRYQCYTLNLSTSGVFLETPKLLPVGARLRLQLETKGREVVLEGRVARLSRTASKDEAYAKPTGMGVKFIQVAALIREILPGGVLGGDETEAEEPAAAGAALETGDIVSVAEPPVRNPESQRLGAADMPSIDLETAIGLVHTHEASAQGQRWEAVPSVEIEHPLHAVTTGGGLETEPGRFGSQRVASHAVLPERGVAELDAAERHPVGDDSPASPEEEHPPPALIGADGVLHLRFRNQKDLDERYRSEIRHGGLFVRGEAKVAEDQKITIEFDLPWVNSRPLRVPARVVHVAKPLNKRQSKFVPGFAVEFDDPDRFRPLLETFVTPRR